LESMGDEGGEDIIVAKSDLDQLVGTDGVVLIDNRDGAQILNGMDGVAEVEKPLAVFDIFTCEQELRNGEAVGFKGVGPGVHEVSLADGGDGLELGEVGGTVGKIQHGNAGADGTGTDDGGLEAAVAKRGDLGGDSGEESGVELASGVGKKLGAQFNHNCAYGRKIGLTLRGHLYAQKTGSRKGPGRGWIEESVASAGLRRGLGSLREVYAAEPTDSSSIRIVASRAQKITVHRRRLSRYSLIGGTSQKKLLMLMPPCTTNVGGNRFYRTAYKFLYFQYCQSLSDGATYHS
jgi:hypothetical protein